LVASLLKGIFIDQIGAFWNSMPIIKLKLLSSKAHNIDGFCYISANSLASLFCLSLLTLLKYAYSTRLKPSKLAKMSAKVSPRGSKYLAISSACVWTKTYIRDRCDNL
jgi:hypothetical protein